MHTIKNNYNNVVKRQLRSVLDLIGHLRSRIKQYSKLLTISSMQQNSLQIVDISLHSADGDSFPRFPCAPVRSLMIDQRGPKNVGVDVLKLYFNCKEF